MGMKVLVKYIRYAGVETTIYMRRSHRLCRSKGWTHRNSQISCYW